MEPLYDTMCRRGHWKAGIGSRTGGHWHSAGVLGRAAARRAGRRRRSRRRRVTVTGPGPGRQQGVGRTQWQQGDCSRPTAVLHPRNLLVLYLINFASSIIRLGLSTMSDRPGRAPRPQCLASNGQCKFSLSQPML